MKRFLLSLLAAAKVARARGGTGPDPQAAFEAAGGVEAWTALFTAYAAMGLDRPADVKPCGALPISP